MWHILTTIIVGADNFKRFGTILALCLSRRNNPTKMFGPLLTGSNNAGKIGASGNKTRTNTGELTMCARNLYKYRAAQLDAAGNVLQFIEETFLSSEGTSHRNAWILAIKRLCDYEEGTVRLIWVRLDS